jgi:regulatory protein
MISKRAEASTARSQESKSSASERAWQRALRLLAVHDRSEHEIRSRLAAQGASPSVIETIVRRLRQAQYLDDGRVARQAAQAARRRGRGRARVHAELTARGVAQGVIDAALEDTFADEPQMARAALERRYPAGLQGPRERARAASFLLRQGFPQAVVDDLLGEDT